MLLMIHLKKALFLSLFLTLSLFANPKESEVIEGRALVIDQGSKLVKIHTGKKAVINWESFSIEEDEIVRFFHQFKNSVVLIRVVGSEKSQILGKIQSNGKVYLINENGILIGKNAFVDASALLCSTLDLPDYQFMNDQEFRFVGDEDASLVNYGQINAREEDVLFLSHRIENHGSLKAPVGKVLLGSGSEISVSFTEKEFLGVNPKLPGDGILNSGTIEALQTTLESNATPFSLGIRNKGRIDALNVVREGGEIFFRAIDCTITNSGELHAKRGVISLKSIGAPIENIHLISAPSGKVSITHKQKGIVTYPLLNKGIIDVSDEHAGQIQIRGTKILQEGALLADGKGGKIAVLPSEEYTSTVDSKISACGLDGEISIFGGHVYNCGSLEAKGNIGGKISIYAETITSPCGLFDVSGQVQGGDISMRSTSSEIPLQLERETTLDTCAYMKGQAGNVEILSKPYPLCNANIKMDGVKAGKLSIASIKD